MTKNNGLSTFSRISAKTVLSRRHLLQVGALGLTGISLPRILNAEAQASERSSRVRADSCILIFLNGGPSHLDMWDMKPSQSDGIRGEFKPIATSLAGYQVCEHLPRMSQHMHRAAVIRSMHHSVNNSHAGAVYTSMTGHDRGDAQIIIGASPADYPSPGSVLSMLQPPQQTIVSQVHLPYLTKEGAKGPPQPGFFGGFLGKAYDPLFVLRDPNSPEFKVPELTLLGDVSNDRFSSRRELFRQLDSVRSRESNDMAINAMDGFQQRAFELLSSETTQRAFRLSEESAKTRESYGRNRYGQSALLARRLVEAGTRAVTISWAPDANATWDTHGGNFQKLKKTLLPQFDAACASLVGDLAERGLLDRTLIAVLGDFGRTPKVDKNNAGRGHWNYCYSQMLVGGGIKEGLVYGSSDKTGAFPASNPLVPGDVVSTIYHLFGISHEMILKDQLNRPHRLVPDGEIISKLLA